MSEEFERFNLPEFYGCYLLRSIPKRLSYYIGSTPSPVRRLRQHNGLLTKGGAYRTRREGTRPWEMVILVYSFPSKIAALQFEHAWQHPHQTRFISSDKRVVKNKKGGRSIHQKLAVLKLLLSHRFFKVMNLKVQIFSQEIRELWVQDRYKVDDPTINCILDEGALSQPDSTEDQSIINHAVSNLKLVEGFAEDVKKKDEALFANYKQRLSYGEITCSLCGTKVNYIEGVNLRLLAFCFNDLCEFASCLDCLYKCIIEEISLTDDKPLIPTRTQCPSCNIELEWSTVVRHSIKSAQVGKNCEDGIVD
ncbi:HCL341Cp [Eremothecium sinecaudum]|uniref:HCL341Cp n=1 Tax=Eremothecium sinecaudum TaxID=45286 RepID=A0A109UWE7_9SACH|nr:HCL341Cp [Eremothecium sinecaudum]AMD19810.1 HCL341Cp [Eremothecium sinecaudum]